jgi:hypothetical protein
MYIRVHESTNRSAWIYDLCDEIRKFLRNNASKEVVAQVEVRQQRQEAYKKLYFKHTLVSNIYEPISEGIVDESEF